MTLRRVLAHAMTGLLAAGTAMAVPLATPAASPVDLIAGHDWTHFAGATVDSSGVRITGLGRQIIGSPTQANPPVNLRGPRLAVSGGFTITATMSGTGGKAAWLDIYGHVPTVYDEWLAEGPHLRVGITADDKLGVQIWDGAHDTASVNKTYGSGLSGTVTIQVADSGGKVSVSANGKSLTSQSDDRVFSSGLLYFGADADYPGGGYTLTGLTATAQSGGTVSVQDAPSLKVTPASDALRARGAALSKPVNIGVALAVDPLLADGTYRTIAGQQFSMVTPENDMKAEFLEPQNGEFVFTDADSIVDFAQANNMKVHAHTLEWQEELPAWMTASMTSAQRQQVLLNYVTTVATHFKGKVAEWDAINEPLCGDEDNMKCTSDGVLENQWEQAWGSEDYLDAVFKAAHAADPNAKLFLNEWGIETSSSDNTAKWNTLLALVKRLLSRGVPISGIGFQTHEYDSSDHPTPATLTSRMNQLAALGLESRISENDVLESSSSSSAESNQASRYLDDINACLKATDCVDYGMWGFTDKYGSNSDYNTYPIDFADALPWDQNLKPKPAYTSLLGAMPKATAPKPGSHR